MSELSKYIYTDSINCNRCIHSCVCKGEKYGRDECGEFFEIVKCKDCRWWHKINNSLLGYCFAHRYNDYAETDKIGMYRYYTRRCKGDFFCADGERKEGE